MPEAETINYILGITTLVGIVFSVFFFFRNPQEKLARENTETDGRAALLAQQVTIEREANDRKFLDFGKRLDDAFTLAQNHTHTVDIKVTKLTTDVYEMNLAITNRITDLTRIIEERIPKRP